MRLLPAAHHGGHDEGREHGDDRDDDEKLDERKGGTICGKGFHAGTAGWR